MNKVYFYIALAVSAVIFFSCEKEVELLDEYSDIPVVYGLLDPVDSITYIRVQKAYLTDGNVYDAAAVADSNLYPYDLQVKITSSAGGNPIVFQKTTISDKDTGIFFSPNSEVYAAVTKDLLNENDTYYLQVNNPVTGTEVTSTSSLIDAGRIYYNYPSLYTKKIDFTRDDNDVEFESIKNGRTYQLTMRFHYGEKNIITGDSVATFTDLVFGSVEANYLDGGEEMSVSYSGTQFYTNLQNDILKNHETENIERYIGSCDLLITATDETFYTFMEVNKPGTSLVIDKPTYTNIENGFGLFASRSTNVNVCTLTDHSKDVLLEDPQYANLNFK